MDRVIKVTLLAEVSGFAAKFAQAKKASDELGTSFKDQSDTIGKGLLAIGVAAGAGVGLAVAKFAEFDQAMSYVQAATHETTSNMQLLRDAALEAGARTVYSATEAANAIEELAKAGVSTKDILAGGLDGALNLAAAGGLDVADAAQIAATAVTQFGLAGKDVPHVADLLAAGAGKAQGSVQDLSMALNQGGLVAKQTGLSIDETTGTLAAFASAGLLGSDAGTSLKTMLQRLTPQSDQARQMMQDLGISAYDAAGNFVGMSRFAGILHTALKDLTPEARNSALSVIFGSDAVRAASVVYDQGAQGIGKWVAAVDDQGYAAETARLRLNNLSGDLEQLGGAFDTLFIKAGSAADGPLRAGVQMVTDFVSALASAPPFVQQTALAVGALVAVVGLAGGAFFLAVPKIVEFNAALDVLAKSNIPGVAGAVGTLQTTAGRAGSALGKVASFLSGPWGVALAGAVVGVDILSKYLDSLKASGEEITNSLKTATSAQQVFATASKGYDVSFPLVDLKKQFGDLDNILDQSAEQWRNVWSRFSGSEYFGAFDALRKIGTQLGTLAKDDLPSAQEAFRTLAADTDGSHQQLWRLLSTMPDYKQALVDQANEMGINVSTSNELTNQNRLLSLAQGDTAQTAHDTSTSLGDIGAAAKDSSGKIGDLAEAISNFNKPAVDATQAQIAFEQAAADVVSTLQDQKDAYEKAHDTLDGFNASLDLSTQEGRDNMSNLIDAAGALNDWTAKQLAASGSVAQSNDILASGRQRLADLGSQFGLSGQALDDFVNKYAASPKDLRYSATISGIDAMRDSLNNVYQTYNGKRITYYIDGTFSTTDGRFKGNADGGAIYGPGGPRDDMVIRRLSNGEHVLDAADVQAMGGQAAVYRFREALHSGAGLYASASAPVAPTFASAAPAAGTEAGALFNVVVQSKGGVDLLQYVDVRVERASQQRKTSLSTGQQKGTN
ncbi:phage tail tape measure protein [Leifsonia sp. NPDC014704]|uniref:phage tail tape measure protein n=1 Tax=Leifsonia sp. NPDC014704 TaxID=3364123 RepID=UPI0036F48431